MTDFLREVEPFFSPFAVVMVSGYVFAVVGLLEWSHRRDERARERAELAERIGRYGR